MNPPTQPGQILLAYRGSIAHNMYVPSTDPMSIDDIDTMGVVVGDKHHYYGLHEWGSRGTREIRQDAYDCVFYEARKFVGLLLQGNPNVLGLLWTRPSEYIEITPSGRRLIDARELFVGKHVYNAFAGYAHAQMEKMETRDPQELQEYIGVTAELKMRGCHPNKETLPRHGASTYEAWSTEKLIQRLRHYQKKGENIGYMGDKRKHLVLKHGYDAKNAAHLIRLLRMCVEFLRTGELQVFRSDAAELLDIKRGRWSLTQIKTHATQLFVEAREARDASVLPPEPNRACAEELLCSIVEHELHTRRS